MSEKFKIASEDAIFIRGVKFEKREVSVSCELEKLIPENVYVNIDEQGAKLFAVHAQIGKETHPFVSMCEAARYIDGAWIVGIDTDQNRYFTPIFTNGK